MSSVEIFSQFDVQVPENSTFIPFPKEEWDGLNPEEQAQVFDKYIEKFEQLSEGKGNNIAANLIHLFLKEDKEKQVLAMLNKRKRSASTIPVWFEYQKATTLCHQKQLIQKFCEAKNHELVVIRNDLVVVICDMPNIPGCTRVSYMQLFDAA